MTRTWVKRIRRLESILQNHGRPPVIFRYGYVRYLPQGIEGERTIAIANTGVAF